MTRRDPHTPVARAHGRWRAAADHADQANSTNPDLWEAAEDAHDNWQQALDAWNTGLNST